MSFESNRTTLVWRACGLLLLSLPQVVRGQNIEWIRQLGSAADDYANAVSADRHGSVFIAGDTGGNLGGPNPNDRRTFLTRYDAAGGLVWTRQFGTTYTLGTGVAADGLGSVYVSGFTAGNLGGSSAGGEDAFLVKYDDLGNHVWTSQFGTTAVDRGTSVSADGLGNIYLAGSTSGNLGGSNAGTSDIFVSKYNSAGSRLWTRQLGTSGAEEGYGAATDGFGNVFVAGYTTGSLAGTNAGSLDAVLIKYQADGTLLWKRQLGSAGDDIANSVAADAAGNVYIAGYTSGNLGATNAGSPDAYLAKYDSDGGQVWLRQFGTARAEAFVGVAADSFGNIFLSGWTDGSLDGPYAGGADDGFAADYDPAGNRLWIRQFGSNGADSGTGISTDNLGNAYVSAYTDKNLSGPNAGQYDAVLLKLATVPEPASLSLAAIGLVVPLSCLMRLRLSA